MITVPSDFVVLLEEVKETDDLTRDDFQRRYKAGKGSVTAWVNNLRKGQPNTALPSKIAGICAELYHRHPEWLSRMIAAFGGEFHVVWSNWPSNWPEDEKITREHEKKAVEAEWQKIARPSGQVTSRTEDNSVSTANGSMSPQADAAPTEEPLLPTNPTSNEKAGRKALPQLPEKPLKSTEFSEPKVPDFEGKWEYFCTVQTKDFKFGGTLTMTAERTPYGITFKIYGERLWNQIEGHEREKYPGDGLPWESTWGMITSPVQLRFEYGVEIPGGETVWGFGRAKIEFEDDKPVRWKGNFYQLASSNDPLFGVVVVTKVKKEK